MIGTSIYHPDRIPTAIMAGLTRYCVAGLRPGDCLYAILCGDLFAALARADHLTVEAIPAIVTHIVRKLPTEAWGSKSKVDSWISRHSMAVRRG